MIWQAGGQGEAQFYAEDFEDRPMIVSVLFIQGWNFEEGDRITVRVQTLQDNQSKIVEFVKNDKESGGEKVFVRELEGYDKEKNLRVKERRHHFKSYSECFIASELIDVLMESGLVESRAHGLFIGRLLNHKQLIRHVIDAHPFSDDYLFFRFQPYPSFFP